MGLLCYTSDSRIIFNLMDMKMRVEKYLLLLLFIFCAKFSFAQEEYMSIVTLEGATDQHATFTSVGVAEKKGDAELNAVRSLFYTLFNIGVSGVNDGKPLIAKKGTDYEKNFIRSKSLIYGSKRSMTSEPKKNENKLFQTTVKITVPMQSLYKELIQNNVFSADGSKPSVSSGSSVNAPTPKADIMQEIALPTIIVVPYTVPGESYDSVLQSDFDRRIAVSKLQSEFEKLNIKTIDVTAKIAAMKLRSEYEAGNADSNDKQLLMSSGADVYVTVEMVKDIRVSGSRVSLILKAYETASGVILGSTDGFTRTYNTTKIDMLCSYAVQDNAPKLLEQVKKNIISQATKGRDVVLQVSIGGNSLSSMSDEVSNGDTVADIIRQWVRVNAEKSHLQGVVAESMIYDSVTMPLKDKDGIALDAAQYAYMLRSHLRQKGVTCSDRVAGNTIYITIE